IRTAVGAAPNYNLMSDGLAAQHGQQTWIDRARFSHACRPLERLDGLSRLRPCKSIRRADVEAELGKSMLHPRHDILGRDRSSRIKSGGPGADGRKIGGELQGIGLPV